MGFVEPGVDLCEISRIQEAVEKHPLFAPRHFTEEELAQCDQAIDFAKCFAGKEAVAKAIGGMPHSFMDICILTDEEGRPQVELRGRAKEYAASCGVNSVSLSFGQIGNDILAVCIAQGLSLVQN